jgi:hypothetical protein
MTDPAFAQVGIAVRTLIALVYLSAAIGKLRHLSVFHGVVANYRLLPSFLVAPVAYGLPPVEAAIGAALLLGLRSAWAEWAAAGLLLVFALAMGINLRRGRSNIDCGCFQSALRQPLRWALVMRNIVLALLLGLAMRTSGPADWRSVIDGLLVGGALFLILQSLNILLSITPSWRRPPPLNPAAQP